DRNVVDAVAGALGDDLDGGGRVDERQGPLRAAAPPAARHRDLAAGIDHLAAGNGDGLQHLAAHLALGGGVEKAIAHRRPRAREIGKGSHSVSSFSGARAFVLVAGAAAFAAAAVLALASRIASSEDWKVT